MKLSGTSLWMTLFVLSYAQASVVYVDMDNTSGIEDGLTWPTAFAEIQDGIDAAVAGDEVWVAEGIYDEVRTSILYDPPTDTGSLLLKAEVALYGGFLGTESNRDERNWTIHKTIIDGAVSRSGAPAYHVVYGAENVLLDGFTIRGGKSDLPPIIQVGTGGGIRSISDGLTIINCVIRDNIGNGTGGISTFGSIGIYDSIIESNTNGGVYVDNDAIIQNCIFRNNTTTRDGSGVRVSIGFGESALIQDCIFEGNTAEKEGGAIHGSGEITIERCVFKDNHAGVAGGALQLGGRPIRINNSIFWNNSSDLRAGAIYAFGGSDFSGNIEPPTKVFVFNSTFVGNSGNVGAISSHGGGAVTEVLNCIFSDNGLQELSGEPGSHGYLRARFSLINTPLIGHPTYLLFEDTIQGEPKFLKAATGDFRITSGSAAIDTGAAVLPLTDELAPLEDILGTQRPLGEGYDLGAFEFDPDNPPMLPEEDDEPSSNSPCFIATAAYGTPLAEEIDTLRSFRDTRLLTNPLGATFVDTYYRLSPPLADYIASHEFAKSIVRASLAIVILTIHYGIWIVLFGIIVGGSRLTRQFLCTSFQCSL